MYRPDTPAHLAGKAAHRLPCLSRRVIAEIRRQMKVYNVESAVVSDEDLAQSVTSNLRTLIDALCMPDEVDLSQARATGSRMGSAWRRTHAYELGIVSIGTPERVVGPVEILRAHATARVGISPAFTGFENTSRALRLAHMARASLPRRGGVGAVTGGDQDGADSRTGEAQAHEGRRIPVGAER
jgi:hypothetical protein